MSYPDSVEYLYALGNELKAGAKFGLERMQTLMAALHHPETRGRFIHVAGTNGKGSTAVMIASVLQQAGFRTGLNPSPHLQEPTARIQINSEALSREHFAELFATVHAGAERLIAEGQIDAHPSYFETVTAMAFLALAEDTDLSVVEVGLGGRLDATNVLTPELCVVTPVAFDHEAYLGNTLASIAFEKAGILKPEVPVVLAPQAAAARAVITQRATELSCPLLDVAAHDLQNLHVTAEGSHFTLDGIDYQLQLRGRHQLENAATAITACRHLRLEENTIQAGILSARWPGRLECVSRSPDVLLDGAHNPAGARALAAYISEFYTDRPVWMVFGAMRDKAIDEVISALFPLASQLILTAPNFPRALRPEVIREMTDHPSVRLAASIPEAIELTTLAPPEAAVFFTGSLYLVGEARSLLQHLP